MIRLAFFVLLLLMFCCLPGANPGWLLLLLLPPLAGFLLLFAPLVNILWCVFSISMLISLPIARPRLQKQIRLATAAYFDCLGRSHGNGITKQDWEQLDTSYGKPLYDAMELVDKES